MRKPWRAARAYQRTRKCTQTKWGQMSITSSPSKAEYQTKLQQSPALGGWTTINRFENEEPSHDGPMQVCDENRKEYEGGNFETRSDLANGDTNKRANENLTTMKRTIATQNNARSVPPWSAPMEMWKVLLSPQKTFLKRPLGLGRKRNSRTTNTAPRMTRTMLKCYYRNGCTHSQHIIDCCVHTKEEYFACH